MLVVVSVCFVDVRECLVYVSVCFFWYASMCQYSRLQYSPEINSLQLVTTTSVQVPLYVKCMVPMSWYILC